jgi:hypothetical protein
LPKRWVMPSCRSFSKTRERLQRCQKSRSKICARAPRYSKSSLDLAASSRKRSMRKASIGVLVRP